VVARRVGGLMPIVNGAVGAGPGNGYGAVMGVSDSTHVPGLTHRLTILCEASCLWLA
jgi:hypothetical protein